MSEREVVAPQPVQEARDAGRQAPENNAFNFRDLLESKPASQVKDNVVRSSDKTSSVAETAEKTAGVSAEAAKNGDFKSLSASVKNAYEKANGDPEKFKEYGKQLGEKLKDSGISVNAKEHSLALSKDGKTVNFKMDGELDYSTGGVKYSAAAETSDGQNPEKVVAGFANKSAEGILQRQYERGASPLEVQAKLGDNHLKPSPFEGGGKFAAPGDASVPPTRPQENGELGGGKIAAPDKPIAEIEKPKPPAGDDLQGGGKFGAPDRTEPVDKPKPPVSDDLQGGGKFSVPDRTEQVEKPRQPVGDELQGGGKFSVPERTEQVEKPRPPVSDDLQGGGKFSVPERTEQVEKPRPPVSDDLQGGGKFTVPERTEQVEKPRPPVNDDLQGGGKFGAPDRTDPVEKPRPPVSDDLQGGGKFNAPDRPYTEMERPKPPAGDDLQGGGKLSAPERPSPWMEKPNPPAVEEQGGGKFRVPDRPSPELERPKPPSGDDLQGGGKFSRPGDNTGKVLDGQEMGQAFDNAYRSGDFSQLNKDMAASFARAYQTGGMTAVRQLEADANKAAQTPGAGPVVMLENGQLKVYNGDSNKSADSGYINHPVFGKIHIKEQGPPPIDLSRRY